MKAFVVMGVIEAAGAPALRIFFTIAVLFFFGVGVFIYRRRHQLFDRDPEVTNDPRVVRHNRFEEILLVWTGLSLVLLSVLYEVWTG
jgi:hypothetical protein